MEVKGSIIWDKIKRICRKQIEEKDYNLYFQNAKFENIEDNKLTLSILSGLKSGLNKYKNLIEETAEILLDESIEVIIELQEIKETINNESYRIQEYKQITQMQTGLNPKFRMDNFVMGGNSKLAYEACFAVINSIVNEEQELPYNPLFIYGSSGLGKTHLMQAVGNEILERNPSKRVYYITSEEFSNEFIRVLREGKIQEFRDTFRNLDVLLLDDIQFFERIFARGSGDAEEEFFHTFNKLQALGKQIIMISDRYPTDIKNLSKRLETRFIQGVSLEMQRPGYETRMAILTNFIEMKGIEIDKTILEYIADSVSSNVRELEGVLTTVIAKASLLGETITLQQVQDELSNMVKTQQSKITAEKIIEIVSTEYDITITDMKSKKRQAEIVNARQIAMFIIKDILDLNLTTIGGLLGGRDHTTVISSIRKIEERIEKENIFKKDLDRIKQKITNN